LTVAKIVCFLFHSPELVQQPSHGGVKPAAQCDRLGVLVLTCALGHICTPLTREPSQQTEVPPNDCWLPFSFCIPAGTWTPVSEDALCGQRIRAMPAAPRRVRSAAERSPRRCRAVAARAAAPGAARAAEAAPSQGLLAGQMLFAAAWLGTRVLIVLGEPSRSLVTCNNYL